MIGFDYTDYIPAAALKAAGCSVVFRYVSNPGWPKNLTEPEATELLAAGIAIVLNYETSASFMLGGYSAGIACARSARAQATALGAPPSARIFYSADFDATGAQMQTVLDFCRGAAQVDGAAQVGVYGGLHVVQAAANAGYATWQTVAWSGGVWDARAAARQTGAQPTVGGVPVDTNEIINLAGLGAWGGPNSGDDVTPEDIQAIAAAVYAFGKEDVNLTTGVMHNVPFGNLAHGAWVSTNDTKNGPVLLALGRIEADVKALVAPVQQPPMDPETLAGVIVADLLPKLPPGGTVDPTALASAVVTMQEQHGLAVVDEQTLAAEIAAHFKVV